MSDKLQAFNTFQEYIISGISNSSQPYIYDKAALWLKHKQAVQAVLEAQTTNNV